MIFKDSEAYNQNLKSRSVEILYLNNIWKCK